MSRWFRVIVMLWFGLYIFSLYSCVSYQPIVTEAEGLVMQTDGDLVLVSFEVVNEKRGNQASNWFYCPGHSFVKGDSYPDFEKYNPKDVKL